MPGRVTERVAARTAPRAAGRTARREGETRREDAAEDVAGAGRVDRIHRPCRNLAQRLVLRHRRATRAKRDDHVSDALPDEAPRGSRRVRAPRQVLGLHLVQHRAVDEWPDPVVPALDGGGIEDGDRLASPPLLETRTGQAVREIPLHEEDVARHDGVERGPHARQVHRRGGGVGADDAVLPLRGDVDDGHVGRDGESLDPFRADALPGELHPHRRAVLVRADRRAERDGHPGTSRGDGLVGTLAAEIPRGAGGEHRLPRLGEPRHAERDVERAVADDEHLRHGCESRLVAATAHRRDRWRRRRRNRRRLRRQPPPRRRAGPGRPRSCARARPLAYPRLCARRRRSRA